jgi:hypothetical protein
MGKRILNLFPILFLMYSGFSQVKPALILDTTILADAIYLDALNQVYLIHYGEKSITKYNLQFKELKKTSFNKGWDHAVMDVSDPFKCLLYYPGDFKIFVLDESLSTIASYDESELNALSAVCHFTTDYIALFSNNILKLKNYEQKETVSSDPLFETTAGRSQFPYQLKQSNEYLYLLRPEIGVSRYTNQLFEEKSWLIPAVKKMDVNGEQLYYLTNNELIKHDTKTKTETVIYNQEAEIKSFAVNAEFIVVLIDDHIKVYRL